MAHSLAPTFPRSHYLQRLRDAGEEHCALGAALQYMPLSNFTTKLSTLRNDFACDLADDCHLSSKIKACSESS